MTEPSAIGPKQSNHDSEVWIRARRDDGAGQLVLQSCDLFADHSTVVLEHCGQQYRLRITSNEKLILTK